MLNKTQIIGNVGRDPELRYTASGKAVCDFSVAVNEKWGKGDDRKEKTTWFRVTCWEGLAETVNTWLRKGRQVFVEGTIEASAWIDKNEEARASLELTARTVLFLGDKDDSAGPQEFADSPTSNSSPNDGGNTPPPPPPVMGDVPFAAGQF